MIRAIETGEKPLDKSNEVAAEQMEMLSSTCIELEGTVARQAKKLLMQAAELEVLPPFLLLPLLLLLFSSAPLGRPRVSSFISGAPSSSHVYLTSSLSRRMLNPSSNASMPSPKPQLSTTLSSRNSWLSSGRHRTPGPHLQGSRLSGVLRVLLPFVVDVVIVSPRQKCFLLLLSQQQPLLLSLVCLPFVRMHSISYSCVTATELEKPVAPMVQITQNTTGPKSSETVQHHHPRAALRR